MNDEYSRLFGQTPTLQNKKSQNQGDMLAMLLKSKKKKQSPPKDSKKKDQFQHQYLKMAQQSVKKPNKIPTYQPHIQKKSQNQLKFQQEMKRAKNQYAVKKNSNLTQKKIYRPQVVDYFANSRPKSPQKKQKKPIKQIQIQRERIKYKEQIRKSNERQRSRDKQRERQRSRDSRQNQRKKQKQRENNYNNGHSRDRSNQKRQKTQIQRQRQSQKQRERQKEKQKRQKQRQRERKHRQHASKYHDKSSKTKTNDHKHTQRHYEDEDSYEDDGFVEKEDDQKFDWKKQIRQIFKYDPSSQKYRKRDREVIEQSGAGRMLAEDRISAKYGRIQQQEDLRREMQAKRKKRQRQRQRQRQKQKQRR